jgi:prepilin-type N-terminal cleavage/methylation domain-containing protein/prepilin-type processing-associated H-X9-DG protein
MAGRRGFTLVEVMVVVGILVLLVAVGWPAVSSGIARAQSAGCLGNLRALGVALNLYLADHGGIMPGVAAARSSRSEEVPVIDTILAGYADNPAVFGCPSDRELFRETGTSYYYNSALGGQPVAAMNFLGLVEGSSRIPVLVDKEGWHSRNPTRVNHLFADGHASWELRLFAQ